MHQPDYSELHREMNHISVLMCSAATLAPIALSTPLKNSLAARAAQRYVTSPSLRPSSSLLSRPFLPPSRLLSLSLCFSVSLRHGSIKDLPLPVSPCVSSFTQSVEEEGMLRLSNAINRQPEFIAGWSTAILHITDITRLDVGQQLCLYKSALSNQTVGLVMCWSKVSSSQ